MKDSMIDAKLFSKMIHHGLVRLKQEANHINALNVFPVPDGDTGTNMSLSFTAGVEAMDKVEADSVAQQAKALAKGLLLGARGNSGVILSQLFRGFAKGIGELDRLSAADLTRGLLSGVETAYQAVIKPVEGTMLTVARDAANMAKKKVRTSNNVIEVMEAVLAEAKAALDRTPDQLPILKEVGVVDSGGQGLVYLYVGFLSALKGVAPQAESFDQQTEDDVWQVNQEDHVRSKVAEMMAQGILSAEEIKYGYCTEFLIKVGADQAAFLNESEIRSQLYTFGDSVLVIIDGEWVKVHIHTEELGPLFDYVQKIGPLTGIKIENMREQFSALQSEANAKKEEPQNTVGVIAVSMGAGMTALFKELGVDHIVQGGQTINPEAQSFVEAIASLPHREFMILPNNSNIILTAQQAGQLVDRPVAVIPTRHVLEGVTALVHYDPSASLPVNEERLNQVISDLKTGQVTVAVRDTSFSGQKIKAGEFLGIAGEEIVAVTERAEDALFRLLDHMLNEESELVTVMYGDGVEADRLNQVDTFLSEHHPDLEVELIDGGQPIYPYLIAVE